MCPKLIGHTNKRTVIFTTNLVSNGKSCYGGTFQETRMTGTIRDIEFILNSRGTLYKVELKSGSFFSNTGVDVRLRKTVVSCFGYISLVKKVYPGLYRRFSL